jgi:hypothetical protein
MKLKKYKNAIILQNALIISNLAYKNVFLFRKKRRQKYRCMFVPQLCGITEVSINQRSNQTNLLSAILSSTPSKRGLSHGLCNMDYGVPCLFEISSKCCTIIGVN